MFACPLNRRRDHARRSWKCAACFPRRLSMPARLTASAHRLNHAPREHLTMQVARACSQSCNSGSPSTFISLRRIPVHDPADPCMQNLTASPVRIAFKSSGSRLYDPPRHALLYHPDHARRGPAPPRPTRCPRACRPAWPRRGRAEVVARAARGSPGHMTHRTGR